MTRGSREARREPWPWRKINSTSSLIPPGQTRRNNTSTTDHVTFDPSQSRVPVVRLALLCLSMVIQPAKAACNCRHQDCLETLFGMEKAQSKPHNILGTWINCHGSVCRNFSGATSYVVPTYVFVKHPLEHGSITNAMRRS